MTDLRALILASRVEDDELSLIGGGHAPHVLPVANVPLVAHAARGAIACGAREIVAVVSDATREDIRAVLGDTFAGLPVRYRELPRPVTFAGALAGTADLLAGGRFIVHLGDSFVLGELPRVAEELDRSGADALVLVREPQGSLPDGVIELDRRRLLRLADDPAPPPSEHVLAGAHAFGPRALDAAREAVAGPPERQTAAATLAALVAAGGAIETRAVAGAWKYCGSVDGLLEANRLVLDELAGASVEADASSARIEGRVEVHRSAVLERVTVRGPAVIGPGAVLVDTFVGPYTSIGENVRMDGAEVEHSIVLAGATVRHPGKRLESSLIGRDAVVAREFALPATLRLRVGPRAEISLS